MVARSGEAGEALLDDVSLRALRRLEGLAEPLMQLSSSARMDALKANIEGASSWKARLAQGLLPNDDTDWPDETFRRALLVNNCSPQMLHTNRHKQRFAPAEYSFLCRCWSELWWLPVGTFKKSSC